MIKRYAGNQRNHFPTREPSMPPLNPDVAGPAPSNPALTVYDEEHAITYMRMLDAVAEGADWREVARIVLHIDPDREPDRARQAFESHLARARWAAREGYRHLLRRGAAGAARSHTGAAAGAASQAKADLKRVEAGEALREIALSYRLRARHAAKALPWGAFFSGVKVSRGERG
jgi:hypothetical protein